MGYFKKHAQEFLLLAGITAVFCFTRIYNLLTLPIFTDEAIYLRWAQIAMNDSAQRFISLTDGKQPLFVWFSAAMMKVVDDPLLAGRLVSVGAGFATMVGLFLLARELFKNRWIGIFTAGLYAIYPFAIVYDKMALYDSLVGTFAVWGLYFVVLLIRTIRLDIALLLGIISGIGALNKTNAFFTIYLLPFSVLLFDIKQKHKKERFLKWVGLCLIVVVLTYGIYSILRLSPFFYIIEQKDATFVYPLKEWLMHPFTYFWDNLWVGQRDWLVKYFNYPFMLLTVISFFISRRYFREKVLLAIWFVAPFLALALFGKTIYPRYIFFMTLSLLPLVAYSFYYLHLRIKNIYIVAGLFVLALLLPLRTSYYVVHDFAHAPIPISDLSQYNNDWPAGAGVKESIALFREEASKQKIALYTEGTFGLMPYAYELYFHDNPNVKMQGIWPIKDEPPQEMLDDAKQMPTYIVFYQPCPPCKGGVGKGPPIWPIEEVYTFTKVAPGTYLTVYKVKAQ